MKIYNHLSGIPKTDIGILTIGTFDGLHLGHRKILQSVIADQNRDGGESFVMTFTNHPFEVLFQDRIPKRLGTTGFEIDLYEKAGIDNLILIKFTREFADISHHSFLKQLLAPFNVLKLVLGFNFRFGKGNKGHLLYLESHEDQERLFLKVIPQVFYREYGISSSLIRKLIQEGEIELVNQMLAREYCIEGKAIINQQIGRNIGFPTVNIINEKQAYPKDGVYKTRTKVGGNYYSSMTFVGRKSIGIGYSENRMIESHIFDFNENIYHQNVEVYFQKRIRNQMKFDSLDQLKNQLVKDKHTVLSLNGKIPSYPLMK